MRKSKFYSLITIVFVAAVFVSCSSRAETEMPQPQVAPEKISQAVARADELFSQREDVEKLREAVETLARVRDPDNRNYEVEWKFSKYNYFLGKQTDRENEREEAFEDGRQSGRIASRIAPDKPDGFFWSGANLGEQAKISPVTVGVKAIGDIREAMNKVIEIDPAYQGASAYDALAQIELTTGLFGGKAERAVEYLEKALEIEKNNSYVRLHLAEAYLAVGKKAEAKKQLEYLLQMKPAPGYAVEYKETSEQAKKMLETKF